MTKIDQAQVVESAPVATPRRGEWVITGSGVVFFAAAYVLAEDFPFRAALFPKMVSVLGLLLSGLRLLGLFREARAGRRSPAAPVHAGQDPPAAATPATPTGAAAASRGPAVVASELVIEDDDAEDDATMEYVFATAGGRAWFEALSWIAFFFLAFFVLGAFASVPLFALFYLRFPGRTSWLSASLYAVVTGVSIYLMFRELVYIPLPTGIVPFLQV